MRTRVAKPGMNFEYLMWLFTRLSGIALILLALSGLVGAFIMGARTQADLPAILRWTFFPNPNHVLNSEIPEIDQVWANLFWTTMQILMIVFAGTHAWNGLRMILEDYVSSPRKQSGLRVAIILLWLVSLAVAITLILTSY